MKKIILKVRGGLGNQLFMLSYAIGLSKLYNAIIYLDKTDYERYTIRNFELDQYLKYQDEIENNEYHTSGLRRIYYSVLYKTYQLLMYVNRKFNKKLKLDKYRKVYNFLGADFTEHGDGNFKQSFRSTQYVYGYFQDTSYVDYVYEEIYSLVHNHKFEETVLMNDHVKGYQFKIVNATRALAVSVRCGDDYLKLGWPICTTDYYLSAIDYFESDVSSRPSEIFVFSDDVNKAKVLFEDLSKRRVTFIENTNPNESLYLMNLCDDFVISNSSFSWWGQKLSVKKSKRVIAPSKWFRESEDYKMNQIYESTFIIMDEKGELMN